jgi:HlyD family secretion protein
MSGERKMTTGKLNPGNMIRRLNYFGFATVALLIFGFGGWAALSQLAGAVIAPGSIVVESSVKKIQHPNGGVVKEILVKEGSEVAEGQVVVRLDETIVRSTVGVVQSQLDELVTREARLVAERDGTERIAFPPQLSGRARDTSAATAMAGEEKLFESRRASLFGQRAQLVERIAQTREEIQGLIAQQEAKDREIKFVGEELAGATELFKKQLVTVMRYTALQRDQARLEGEHGRFIAEIARTRGRIAEIELQIAQLDQNFRTDLMRDLREAEGKIAELRERLIAVKDQLNRIEIRAPQSGFVHQLSVHTVGGVIGAAETIMMIVPKADMLVVESRVAPADIDQVAMGAKVTTRILAGNRRTVPEVAGIVTRVSADLMRDQQTGVTYYTVRATIPEAEVERLGDLRLMPGMPVEAYIETQQRSALQFLIKPLEEQIVRTFRER